MKRGYDGRSSDGDRKRRGGESSPLPFVLKFLTPEVLASAVIGKGGSVISRIRESTQARVGLTDHGEFYPSTDSRILTAQAHDEDSLVEVSRQIIAKLAECADGPAAGLDTISDRDELKLKVVVPKMAVGGIIGKGGQAIKNLRETSGAKVSIAEPAVNTPSSDQLVTIIGSVQALEYVMSAVNREVQGISSESWFSSWASSPINAGGSSDYTSSWNGGSRNGYPPLDQPSYGDGGHSSSGSGRGRSHGSSGIDEMIRVAQDLPSYVVEDSRGFALSCIVPEKLVGGLIGRGGSGTKDIATRTNTEIRIRELHGDSENRQLNITGPLASTCAAYMLMMKRYLDAEAVGLGAPALEDRPQRSSGRSSREWRS
mmetsp:Transcript_21305/g.40765  ORF Transcript_21305/g.40765 Transcript_21305/m.40765 type:complete len:371 (-) Transcript_21305:97-1209(-)